MRRFRTAKDLAEHLEVYDVSTEWLEDAPEGPYDFDHEPFESKVAAYDSVSPQRHGRHAVSLAANAGLFGAVPGYMAAGLLGASVTGLSAAIVVGWGFHHLTRDVLSAPRIAQARNRLAMEATVHVPAFESAIRMPNDCSVFDPADRTEYRFRIRGDRMHFESTDMKEAEPLSNAQGLRKLAIRTAPPYLQGTLYRVTEKLRI